MAVEHLKSSIITNATASPVALTPATVSAGQMRRWAQTFEISAAASATSTYRGGSIPSNCIVDKIEYASDDQGTTGLANIGLYFSNGGLVIDADCFASALDLKTAAVARTECMFEAAVNTIDDVEKYAWQMAGLSADPGGSFDVTVSLTEACDVGGTLTIWCYYAV